MEKNTKLGVIKKISVILIAIIICYFIIPNPVNAASWLANAGGKLIDAVLQFFVFLGDCVLELLQNSFISSQDVIVAANSSSAREVNPLSIVAIIVGALVIAVGVCVAIASWGTLSGVSFATVVAGIKIIGGVVLATTAGTIVAVEGTHQLIEGLSGEFDLPMIRYTPYEIFSGQIPVFDVNFIDPNPSVKEYYLIKGFEEYHNEKVEESLRKLY